MTISVSSAPCVVIVILNWNQREDTLACLESLKNLSYPNYRIVVVDNGSTDGSQDAISRLFDRITLLQQDNNIGCSGGRNVGAHYALDQNADYVLFLDNDTVVPHDFLNHLIESAENNPAIGIEGPKIYYFNDRQTIWTAGAMVDQQSGLTRALRNGEVDEGADEEIYPVDFVAGCALLAKRSVFETIGFFDDDYFIYFEDTDWCVRAGQAGFQVVVVPRSVLWHKESQALGGVYSPGKTYYMTRNQLLFIKKLFSKQRSFVLSGRILLNEIRTIILHSILPRYKNLRPQRKARVWAVIDYLRGQYGADSRIW